MAGQPPFKREFTPSSFEEIYSADDDDHNHQPARIAPSLAPPLAPLTLRPAQTPAQVTKTNPNKSPQSAGQSLPVRPKEKENSRQSQSGKYRVRALKNQLRALQEHNTTLVSEKQNISNNDAGLTVEDTTDDPRLRARISALKEERDQALATSGMLADCVLAMQPLTGNLISLSTAKSNANFQIALPANIREYLTSLPQIAENLHGKLLTKDDQMNGCSEDQFYGITRALPMLLSEAKELSLLPRGLPLAHSLVIKWSETFYGKAMQNKECLTSTEFRDADTGFTSLLDQLETRIREENPHYAGIERASLNEKREKVLEEGRQMYLRRTQVLMVNAEAGNAQMPVNQMMNVGAANAKSAAPAAKTRTSGVPMGRCSLSLFVPIGLTVSSFLTLFPPHFPHTYFQC